MLIIYIAYHYTIHLRFLIAANLYRFQALIHFNVCNYVIMPLKRARTVFPPALAVSAALTNAQLLRQSARLGAFISRHYLVSLLLQLFKH